MIDFNDSRAILFNLFSQVNFTAPDDSTNKTIVCAENYGPYFGEDMTIRIDKDQRMNNQDALRSHVNGSVFRIPEINQFNQLIGEPVYLIDNNL